MKGKYLLILVAVLIAVLLLSACNTNGEHAGKTFTVKITAINDGEYTALIGTAEKNEMLFLQKEPPIMPTGEPFELSMPDGIKQPPEGGVQVKPFMGEKADGTFSPEYVPQMPNGTHEPHGMPPDMMPNGTHEPFMGDMPPMMGNNVIFTQGEGTITFKIDSETEILKNGETASVSHITVESILNVSFDTKGKTSKIEILN